MEEKKTELEERLDRSLKHALRHRKDGKNLHYIPLNYVIGAKTGDDVQTFVRQWAEKNDVHLFVLDWGKLDLDYINDYENGLLKDLSAPKTVMYLENFTGIEFKKRYLVSNVYKDCVDLRRIFFLQSQRTIRIFRKNNFIAWIVQNPRVLGIQIF